MSQLNVDTIKKADGTGNLSVPAETGTVVTTASPSLGRRNLIINGAMQVAQRGTSATNPNEYAVADRMYLSTSGGAFNYTVDYEEDAPTDFQYSTKYTATGDNGFGSNGFIQLLYRLESQNIRPLYNANQSMTLSFWVKASVAGTYTVNFVQATSTSAQYQGNLNTYTINNANTWERKTVTVPTSVANGTFASNTDIGLQVSWPIGYGTGRVFSGTTGEWTTGETRTAAAVTGSVNLMETSGTTWQITGVQLEVGSVATPFEHRSYGEELALCQRYYEEITRGRLQWSGKTTNNQTYCRTGVSYATVKRATPTVTATRVDQGGGFNAGNTPTVDQNNTDGFYVYTLAVADSNDAYIFFEATSDAEL